MSRNHFVVMLEDLQKENSKLKDQLISSNKKLNGKDCIYLFRIWERHDGATQ